MTTEAAHFDAPRGMRDFYPADMAVRNAIFDAWLRSARAFGFAQYDACVVESLDLLKRKGGEEIVEQIYAFKDKSDRDLALRPEMTPTLARMIVARQGQLVFPLKWFAVAQCFRYERMSRGRKREHYQWNLDVVGEASVSAEVEVLACAVQALNLLGLNAGEVKIHLSSRALLAALLAKAGIPPAFHAATFLALDKRGKLEDADIRRLLQESGLDLAAIEAVFRILGLQSLEQAAAMLGEQNPALTAVQTLFRLANEDGLGAMLVFDIGVVRGLGYYTGLVFEAFDAERKFRALFGGGRYDNLLGDVGGAPMTAVGLGFGDVVIAELLADKGRIAGLQSKLNCAVGYMEDFQQSVARQFARALRRGGMSVDMALHAEKPKQFFGRVGKGAFQKAVYVGPDDVARGAARIKNLDDRTEEEMPLADLPG
ncbi:MAG: histidine--tRNA ligase [Kiritimatiellia bacterium]|jgi:histidyl-tRNA synthetase